MSLPVLAAKKINEAHGEAVFHRMLRKSSRSASALDAMIDALAEEFGTVYFLQAGPFIKIGFTRWPIQRRIAQLSTGCPYEISILAEIRGSPDVEAQFHLAFAKHRARGEWFYASAEILSFIASLPEVDKGVAA